MLDTLDNTQHQLKQLADTMAVRRDAVLDTWREQVQNDPHLQDVSQWTHAQFQDHVPAVLDAFSNKLKVWPDKEAPGQEASERKAADDHSRHRWQQGYDLRSLVREWGHLNECLVDELHNYAAQHGELDELILREAQGVWARLLNDCVSENVVEYSRLLQAEAATRAKELEQALEHLHALEEQRGEILRTAAHDLKGNLSVVMGSASMMEKEKLSPQERADFRQLFEQGSGALNQMLTDLMSMARLEAGQERREIAFFDAGEILNLLCASSQHLAQERGLYLRFEGPENLPVEGDAARVQRIAQNLLLNGLKYTEQGGVSIRWAEVEQSPDNWELLIEDTGPGLSGGTAAPLAHQLEAAANAAQSVEGVTLKAPEGVPDAEPQRPHIAAGEGVGLSIVKRLCELLNASIELQTTEGVGSNFRIVFPKKYQD